MVQAQRVVPAGTAGDVRGVDFILAPTARSQRVRFTRSPLGVERGGFLGWLGRLFGRRRSPFRASAIAFAIDRELGFSRGVVSGDGRVSLAPDSIAVEGLTARLLVHAGAAYRRADDGLDAIGDSLRQEELWLDQCRPDAIVSTLATDLSTSEAETRSAMRAHKPTLDSARDAVDRFRVRHDLDEDVSPGKPIDRDVGSQLGLILIGEFMLNAAYQKSLAKDGLIGGLSLALFCSLAFVSFGLLIGWGIQRSAKRGAAGALGWAAAAVGATVATAFISILTLVRVAAEHGDRNPFDTARVQFLADKLSGFRAMTDLTAFAFAILSVAVITVIARKFLGYYGDFPQYRKHALAHAQEEAVAGRLFGDAKVEIGQHVARHRQRLDKAPEFIAHCKAPIQSLVVDHENAIDQFRSDAQDLEHAGRLFDAFIREHGGGAGEHLRQRVREQLTPQLAELAHRHAEFVARAEALCAREDVAEATVEAARGRFATLVEQAQSALDEMGGRPPLPAQGGTAGGGAHRADAERAFAAMNAGIVPWPVKAAR